MTRAGDQPSERRARRSDALRNRQQVLDTATDVFRTVGLDFSVNDLARRAGVGVGTLYRHFPTKEALLTEVLTTRLRGLVCVSNDIVEDEVHRPDAQLVAWIHALAAHITNFVSVHDWVMTALTENPVVRDLHLRVLADGQALLDRARTHGTARADFDIRDLVSSVAALTATATTDDPDRPGRLLSLLINGVLAGEDEAVG